MSVVNSRGNRLFSLRPDRRNHRGMPGCLFLTRETHRCLLDPISTYFFCCHCMNFLSSASDSSGVGLSPPAGAIVLVDSETAGCVTVVWDNFGIRMKKTNTIIAETPIPATKPTMPARRTFAPLRTKRGAWGSLGLKSPSGPMLVIYSGRCEGKSPRASVRAREHSNTSPHERWISATPNPRRASLEKRPQNMAWGSVC
jgi:hypothetical protein